MSNPINKIYDIKTIGFDLTHKQLKEINQAFKDIVKSKRELNKAMADLDPSKDAAKWQKLNDKLQQVVVKEGELARQTKILIDNSKQYVKAKQSELDGTKKAAGAYFALLKSYKDADLAAKNMAAEFGANSKQAIAAAKAAGAYKMQLIEINNLQKTLAKPATSTVVAAGSPQTTKQLTLELARQQEAVKKVNQELRQQAKDGVAATGSLERLRTQLALLTIKRNKLQIGSEEFKQTQLNLAALNAEIKKHEEASGVFTRSVGNYREGFKSIATGLKNVGIAALGALGINSLFNVISNVFQLRSQFEKSSANLSAITGATGQDLTDLKAAAVDLSRQGSQSATEYVEAMKLIASAKPELLTAKDDLIDVTKAAKLLSDASGLELPDAATRLTDALNQFGAPAAQAAQYVDALAAAAKFGAAEVPEITEALVQFGAIAKSANIDIYESSAAIEVLAEKGIKGAEAGTKLRNVFLALSAADALPRKAQKQLQDAGVDIEILKNKTLPLETRLKELSKVANDAGALFQIFGKENLVAGQIILQNIPRFAELTKQIHEQGVATEQAKVNTDTLENSWQKLKNVLSAVFLEGSNSPLKKAIDGITEGVVGLIGGVKQAYSNAQVLYSLLKENVALAFNLSTLDIKGAKANIQNIKDTKERAAVTAEVNNMISRADSIARDAAGKSIAEQKEILKGEKSILDAAFKKREAIIAEGKLKSEEGKKAVREFALASQVVLKIQKSIRDAETAAKKSSTTSNDTVSTTATATPKTKVDRLSVDEQNELKRIEATRQKLLAIENTNTNKIAKERQLTLDEEIIHLKNIEKINVDALNAKVEYLKKKGQLNAEETLQVEKFGEDISVIELDTSRKLQEIEKKRFADQEALLKETLDERIRQAKVANEAIQDNINATPTEKAQAQLDFDNSNVAAEKDYYDQLLILSSEYNKEAVKKVMERLAIIQDVIDKDRKKVSLSTLATIDQETQNEVARIKAKYDKIRETILASNKSLNDKLAAINTLNKVANVEVGGAELKGANEKVQAAKLLLEAGLITAKQFDEIYAAAIKGQQNLNAAITEGKKNITDFKQLLQEGLSNLFGFDEGSEKAKLLSETITGAFNLAKEAMTEYYEAEKREIERSNQLTKKRLDIELDQAKARAQTQAERDSLDKQFAAKKEAEDRKAFEKNKKLQVEQAKINLAIQLSNLAVVAFAPNPANIATLGVAGAIMYGIQAAIALASYAVNVNRIRSAQFEFGGLPGRGGKIGGQPHSRGGTPFSFKGSMYEAEADELAIIRTKGAPQTGTYNLTGNFEQIASALNAIGGGISFAPGAKLQKFEYGGSLGSSLQAPVFIPSSTNVFNNDNSSVVAAINELKEESKRFADETSNRIDRMQVIQVTSSVTGAQRKEAKQSSTGTL